MATVRFTESIQRHVQCPTRNLAGSNVREVLEGYFAENERARGYVLDDQGALRRHIAIFIDGRQVRDRIGLTDPVDENAVIDLIQSLSGGEQRRAKEEERTDTRGESKRHTVKRL